MASKASKKRSRPPLVRQSDGRYRVRVPLLGEAEILAVAEQIIERRFMRQGAIDSAADCKRFLRAKLITQDREQFGCLFLDRRHRIIAWEVLFQGTVDGCAVYQREVARRALLLNSSAIVLAHQHPSGDPTPSPADRRITRELRTVLAMLNIDLLDHVVVGRDEVVSLGERGLL